jgi:BirA family transcriptional regulator, biotin operon repressor / biotin---[acetyl-CoA-carboxylase] ligase
MGVNLDLDFARLDDRLEAAVAGGLLSSGMAHRVGLAARLAASLRLAGPEAGAAAVSGQELAGIMGVSRAAVQKHVHHLQSLGFAVASSRGTGYRLERPFTDLVTAEAVLPFLLGSAWPEGAPASELPHAGLPYLYLERCESTNLVLREAMAARTTSRGDTTQMRGDLTGPQAGATGSATAGAAQVRRMAAALPSGAVAVTDAQTSGRGRLNRTWSSLPGQDLTFSVLLRPSLAPSQAHLLSLTAALAVAEVLEALPGVRDRVGVKWPNDVLLGDKKVCGILLEGSMDADRLHWVVAGIGLNVNSASTALLASSSPEEAAAWRGKSRPVSLREHLGRAVSRAPLLAVLLDRLGGRWAALDAGAVSQNEVLEQLRRRDALTGRSVEIAKAMGPREPAVVGEAAGFGPEGQLLVRQASGQVVEVFAGDVTVMSVGHAKSGAEARAGL